MLKEVATMTRRIAKRSAILACTWALALTVGTTKTAIAQAFDSTTKPDIEKLLNQLVETSEPGFGYSLYFSGSEFLPYENTGQISTGILGAMRATRSSALREIVRRGVTAAPTLLKHISDDRPTKIKPFSGMDWMSFSDEYDYNRRTRTTAPIGVNRDDFGNEKNPRSHAVTVGDLCFVALGQIVNRRFSATRYQPTGGLIVSSPTYSAALRKGILENWSSLSAESHKWQLVEDFLKPDHEDRRTGAYLRLALYYPETVEELVLNELAKPTFDVFVIEDFCRKALYKIDKAVDRKSAYERFLRQRGNVFAAGIQQQLFDDLDSEDRFGARPRELLSQLFGRPANVKPADRPASDHVSEAERARFIATLTHDDSRKVGEVVKALFVKNANDDYFASSCLRCMASRGYVDFLLDQLRKIDPAVSEGKRLHTNYIEAIGTCGAPVVRAKLFDILKRSANEEYFIAALPAADCSQGTLVAEAARKLVARLPDDSKAGMRLLKLIGERSPNAAKQVYLSFLSTGSAIRAETMCRVLWYNHPLAKELLAPLLDDKRELAGFSIRMRVCDRAAQAISHTTKGRIRFDSDWSLEQKDEQIEKLKQYCKVIIQ